VKVTEPITILGAYSAKSSTSITHSLDTACYCEVTVRKRADGSVRPFSGSVSNIQTEEAEVFPRLPELRKESMGVCLR
jgi:hypothetical protein